MAFDLGANEREGCSKLLQLCTHEFGFGNMDFGYAFDYLIWVSFVFVIKLIYRIMSNM
jgi:hypothetical protein